MRNGIRYFATNRDLEHLGRRTQEGAAKEDARKLRIRLQQGGYYFVDMNKYMPYYFGEVDTQTMPIDAIVEDSEKDVFQQFLSNEKIGRVVICIHGFNVHLFESHIWFRILTETLARQPSFARKIVRDPGEPILVDPKVKAGELSAFIGFSWPSNGSTLSYNRDQLDAAASAQPLAGLISRIILHGKKVSLLCHSMGNYVACSMLQGIINQTCAPGCFTLDYLKQHDKDNAIAERTSDEYVNKLEHFAALIGRGEIQKDESVVRPDHFVDSYVMIAPDVERRHVTKASAATMESDYVGPFYSGLQHLVRDATNVYSRFDGALSVSNLEKKPKSAVLAVGDKLSSLTFGLLDFLERNPDYKWESRLGSGPHPSSAPPNLKSINATELAKRPIDHSDHIDSAEVVHEIGEALGL